MSEVKLTEEQGKLIVNEWNNRPDNPPSLIELIHLVFGESFDGRSKEGRAVKSFLATRDIKARGAHEYQAKEIIDLSDEDKEFIRNNVSTMSGLEMAKIIFANNELSNLHQETRTVNNYIKELENSENIEVFEATDVAPNTVEYKPPKTFTATINKIIKFVPNSINKERISPKQKKDTEALMGFLSTYRFLHQMSNLRTQIERDLFESSFIRYTYDKWDLTQEEVDQYIVLASEVIISSNIQRRIEHLQDMLDDTANDSEGRRISMSLVEAISSRQTEYNQSVNRQTKLLSDLKMKRSDRLKKLTDSSASILNLVEIWKEEQGRKELLQLAEARKKVLEEEVEKLTTMDEMKSKIMGIDPNEIFNG